MNKEFIIAQLKEIRASVKEAHRAIEALDDALTDIELYTDELSEDAEEE